MHADLKITNQAALSVKDFMVDADQGPCNLRFINRPSVVTWALIADAITDEYEIFSGERLVQSRSLVPGGGTDGVFPNITDRGSQFAAYPGEILAFRVRETGNVATTDAMLSISVDAVA